ncbi:BamA/TamA family outer membrane protein [Achromobacter veterisilvae]|uniref:BamA/TamA family outer membrane protein n=2 Tax=Achromobacter veterisilvae TaxID=2069367 RepID=A0ABZ2S7F9_9BURK
MRTAMVTLLSGLLAHGAAHGEPLSFTDDRDGDFDTSDFLLRHQGALPVPVIITEPAVGYGGGLMLLYFSEPAVDASRTSPPADERKAPPNITGIGGLATENGSRGGGLFHFHSWDADRYRYLGALAQGRANLEYYGAFNHGRSYQVKGTFLVQQILARIGDSPWYVGPRYTYFRSNTRFTGAAASELSQGEMAERIGKAGLVVDYDTRDNMFYPNRGTYAELEAQFSRNWLGSDQSFENYRARGYTWVPLAPRWTLGLRGDGQFTRGTVPFYAQPYVDLRGVSRGRYQDRDALALEAELRWQVKPRWSVLGFTGVGKAYGNWKSFSAAPNVASVGAGFRYLIAHKLGLAVGIDVAHSKDQNAFYIQVGSAWR